jgi:hypothetical protein
VALPDVPCSSCGGPVKQRRRSASGKHFCTSPECQRAKGRHFYRRRAEVQTQIELQLLLNLVHALAHRRRQQCPECGLANALPGYKHPNRLGQACLGVGQAQMGPLAGQLIEAIWPPSTREYEDFS